MIKFKNYYRPQTLEEAFELNQKKSNRIIGGMMWVRTSNNSVGGVIDLSGLGLDYIRETEDAFEIGAMTSLRTLELHKGLNDYTSGALRNSVKDIIGVQFRNGATLGGSIFGRFGFSDVCTLFLALDSYVELYKGGIIPLRDFIKQKKDNDILTKIIVKKTAAQFAYLSVRIQRTDFPVLTCAVCVGDGCTAAVIGARPGIAVSVADETGILSDGITAESAKAFAEYTASRCRFGSNIRGSAAYRKHLARVLTERALLQIGGVK